MNTLCLKCKWFENNICTHIEGSCVQPNTDGRRPLTVDLGVSMEEDAKRRDFTINAMFMDPQSEQIFDFVGGQEDLKNRMIRFVGSPMERIAEDKLRMLRALRFALKLDFYLDDVTFEAIKSSAHLIHEISAERIHQELEKMFMIRKPSAMLDILLNSGLLKEILPEVERLSRVPQDPKWHPEGAKVIRI